MRFVFRVLLFSVFLNVATGIMILLVPEFAINQGGIVLNVQEETKLTYNDTLSVNTNALHNDPELSGNIKPNSQLQDKTSSTFRIMDLIGLGAIKRIINFLDVMLFGFINVLDTVIGGFLISSNGSHLLHDMIFSGLRTMFILGYALLAFTLLSGRNPKAEL